MPGTLYHALRRRYGTPGTGPSRREMLQQTIAAAAGLMLSRQAWARPRSRGARVLVVGAGFAGLAAAYELHAAGYDVEVFEARARLGGRVRSFHDLAGGATVEGGAELIGSNHPAWNAYREQFHLEFLDVPEDADDGPVVLGSAVLSARDAEALWQEMEAAYTALNREAASVDADAPWTSPGAEARDRMSVAAWIDGAGLSPHTRAALHAEFTADNGVETAWQSQLGNLAQIKGGGLERYWTDSEVYRCRGGNDQLAARLAGALPAGAVRLRTAVTAIIVSDERVSVRLADGTTVDGDEVVLAVPPSVWRRIAFDPPLPTALMPQMGANVKYLAVVRSRFWRRARLSPEMLSDGPVQLTWEATGGQHGPEAVLTAFSGGEAAETTRTWRPAERANRYLRTLEVAYRDIAREFVGGRFMDWPSDPWTRASYSFPAPGQVTAHGPLLRAGRGRLHFAGEHTNYAFVGYMEGALGSGIALARRLAEKKNVGGPFYENRKKDLRRSFSEA